MAGDPDNGMDVSGRLLAQKSEGDNAPPYSVSELSGALKRVVEDRFGRVRVRGEISGWKRAASGHCYFALKDDQANLDSVMWKGNAARIAFAAEDGLDVIATGKLTTYPGRSKYQVVVDSLELAGEGALMQLFEKLKAKLEGEGLFAAERKKRLPRLPRVIGVVTSPTGSVIRDILHRLEDRFPSHVIVWPTRVQGDGAAAEVAAAIAGFNALPADGPIARPDLLIVARGGGSIEDLWAFNEEEVVRAVAASDIPIISAVGHETDTSLCDYAADMRAPTPTAAAEIGVPVRAELIERTGEAGLRLGSALRRLHALSSERLEAQRRLLPNPAQIVEAKAQRVDDLGDRLAGALHARASRAEGQLARAQRGFGKGLLDTHLASKARDLNSLRLSPAVVQRAYKDAAAKLDALWRTAAQLDPDKPLERGFARVESMDGATLASRKDAAAHSAMRLKFKDGTLDVLNADGSGAATISGTGSGAGSGNRLRPKKAANKTPPVSQSDLFE